MSWKSPFNLFSARPISGGLFHDALRHNEHCFIRKEHKCGKMFGASKSCFIACPTDDELEPILGLMSEKLMKSGIEPIIAVKERAYGQDIFCTKICGKIIEARFCIAILDDTIIDNRNIPNPNVYYEYGLMTSLRKHVIPLQKEDQKLAFNIQSYDTIKFNPKNVVSELERAIKDAIRITETGEKKDKKRTLSEKTIFRKLELSGYESKEDEWFLSDVIEDTNFKGFVNANEHCCLYLGKIDNEEDYKDYLEDTDIVMYRTEKKCAQLEEESNKLQQRYMKFGSRAISFEKRATERDIYEIKDRLSLVKRVVIGFIVNDKIYKKEYKEKLSEIVAQNIRYILCISEGDAIMIKDKIIEIK